jgi:hypothetical protein
MRGRLANDRFLTVVDSIYTPGTLRLAIHEPPIILKLPSKEKWQWQSSVAHQGQPYRTRP